MTTINVGDVFRTYDSSKYAIVIGISETGIYVLKATYKHTLPSGGEVSELSRDEFDSQIGIGYDFSHNIDVSGWLEFKKKQIFKILKG
jgi:hypothetical protein